MKTSLLDKSNTTSSTKRKLKETCYDRFPEQILQVHKMKRSHVMIMLSDIRTPLLFLGWPTITTTFSFTTFCSINVDTGDVVWWFVRDIRGFRSTSSSRAWWAWRWRRMRCTPSSRRRSTSSGKAPALGWERIVMDILTSCCVSFVLFCFVFFSFLFVLVET